MNTESIFSELVKIQSWPSVALVFALIIVVGYCLRFWPTFPNKAIPLVVILVGAMGMMLLSDATPKDINPRIWHTKNCIVGIIIGFVAWMTHNLVISKIEDYLSSKFPSVSNLLGSTPTPPPTPPPTT